MSCFRAFLDVYGRKWTPLLSRRELPFKILVLFVRVRIEPEADK